MNRLHIRHAVILMSSGLLALAVLACNAAQPSVTAPTPAVIEVTKVVEKEKIVEKQVQVVVTSTPAPRGGDLVVAMPNEPTSLDPNIHANRYGAQVIRNVFDPLVAVDTDGSFKPALATSWESAPDQRSMTFVLRKDVKFHDGTPFNAEALKFNFDRIVDPATKSLGAVNFIGPYERSEVIDPYTLKVYWKQPFPFLNSINIQNGTYFAPNSPAAVKKWGDDYQQHPVGTGPYVFKEWVLGDHITLTKNADYNWAPKIYDHDKPYLNSMTYKFVPEAGTRAAVLQTGEVNLVIDLPTEWAPRLSTNPNYQVIKGDVAGPGVMYVISTVWPELKDIRVRRALQYAIDRDAINNTIYSGLYTPQSGPLADNTACSDKTAATMYKYDPAKAKALLEEAGWKDTDRDGILDKDGKPFKFTIWTIVDPRVGEAVQAQLRDIGIDGEAIFHKGGPLRIEKARAGDFGLMYLAWTSPDPGILKTLWHSKQIGAWNFAIYRDAKLDSLLDKGEVLSDLKERCTLYAEAQRLLMEEAIVIPIHAYAQIMASRKEVKGLILDKSGDWGLDLYDTYIDQAK